MLFVISLINNSIMSLYWVLNIVPTFFIFLTLVVGLIGFLAATFVGKIPFASQYRIPIQVVQVFSLLLILSGVYLQGGVAYKQSIGDEVAELKVKLAVAEAKSQKVNIKIVEKIVKDTEIIREKGKTITEYVDREVVKYDYMCKLTDEVINAHNQAASLTVEHKGEKK